MVKTRAGLNRGLLCVRGKEKKAWMTEQCHGKRGQHQASGVKDMESAELLNKESCGSCWAGGHRLF